jgi:hypothetical protein
VSWSISGENAFDEWDDDDPERRLDVIAWVQTFLDGPPKGTRVPLRLGVVQQRVPARNEVMVTWLEMPYYPAATILKIETLG